MRWPTNGSADGTGASPRRFQPSLQTVPAQHDRPATAGRRTWSPGLCRRRDVGQTVGMRPVRLPQPAHAGTLACTALLLFVIAAIAVQAARPEYDWWLAPLSFYLSGPHSGWLQLAYAGLGLATTVLGLGLRASLVPAARVRLVPLLLGAGGIALVVTAAWPGPSPGRPVSDGGVLIHGLAAMTAFLCVGTAMLLQSSVLHRDAHWRPLAWPLLALAAIAFAGLWLHALWRELPRGASQKAVIALYLLWLGAVALRLRAVPRASSVHGRH